MSYANEARRRRQRESESASTLRVAFLSFAVVLFVGLIGGGLYLTIHRASLQAESKRIRFEQYQRVKNGMTMDEVAGILGPNGKLQSSSSVNVLGTSIETHLVMWQNADGSNAIVTFQGGRVALKAQAGLK